MRPYAEAAIMHADQQHGVALGWVPDDIPQVDRILDHCRALGDKSQYPSLALCYGSWLGELAVRQLAARWVGLHEPHPPRLLASGRLCSPIEAVTRRLETEAESSLAERWTQLGQWARQTESWSREAISENEAAWDNLASDPAFCRADPLGEPLIDVDAAREAIDPWLGALPLPGARLLLLAAGGGTHSLLHARAGFRVTVVDISQRMLDVDRRLADRWGLPIVTRQASMDDLSAFQPGSFDAVAQPVSSCYVPDVIPVYRQVARILRMGGIYTVQHKQPASMQAISPALGDYTLVHPAFAGQRVQRDSRHAWHLEPGTVEFIQPLDMLLGGLCRSGFSIDDFSEPPRADAWAPVGSPAHRACFLPPYLKIKATKRFDP